jgi:hypothetical protein
MTEIKRSRPKYQDALETVYAHIVQLEAERDAAAERLESVTRERDEQSRCRQAAADAVTMWQQQWTELNGIYNALHKEAGFVAGYLGGDSDPTAQELYERIVAALKLGGYIPKTDVARSPQEQLRMQLAGRQTIDTVSGPLEFWKSDAFKRPFPPVTAEDAERAAFKRPWDTEPVAATWAEKVTLERSPSDPGVLDLPSDEQFAAWKKEWEGFVPGQPDCKTCERRVQEGEQQPFPVVQQRQWVNHGGRVWTRLCEACRKLAEPPCPRCDKREPHVHADLGL